MGELDTYNKNVFDVAPPEAAITGTTFSLDGGGHYTTAALPIPVTIGTIAAVKSYMTNQSTVTVPLSLIITILRPDGSIAFSDGLLDQPVSPGTSAPYEAKPVPLDQIGVWTAEITLSYTEFIGGKAVARILDEQTIQLITEDEEPLPMPPPSTKSGIFTIVGVSGVILLLLGLMKRSVGR